MEGAGRKILTPKQMLQRLPIVLPEVKAGNNSENLLNEIRQKIIIPLILIVLELNIFQKKLKHLLIKL